MTFTFFALPAIVGLVTKAGMFAYTRWSGVHNALTRCYLALLFTLVLYNVFEIGLFVNHRDGVTTPLSESMIRLVVSAMYVATATFLHLALITVIPRKDDRQGLSRLGAVLLYVPPLVLLVLFWGTSLLVTGFVPMSYTYTRVPGPLYFLFELYISGYLIAAFAALLYGAYRQTHARQRARNKIMLLGSLPMIVLGVAIVVLQRFGLRAFNATATITVTMTICLAFAAYATHARRPFEPEFLVPWSRLRKRKATFYSDVEALSREIKNMASVADMVQRLADVLECPIVLVSGPTSSFAMAGDAQSIARFPPSELKKIDRMLVAGERAEESPDIHVLMNRYQVAAIVPFHPHSEAAATWMLLGESFSEHVYSPHDFKMVEALFARLADHFLDTQLLLRYRIDNSRWLSTPNAAQAETDAEAATDGDPKPRAPKRWKTATRH